MLETSKPLPACQIVNIQQGWIQFHKLEAVALVVKRANDLVHAGGSLVVKRANDLVHAGSSTLPGSLTPSMYVVLAFPGKKHSHEPDTGHGGIRQLRTSQKYLVAYHERLVVTATTQRANISVNISANRALPLNILLYDLFISLLNEYPSLIDGVVACTWKRESETKGFQTLTIWIKEKYLFGLCIWQTPLVRFDSLLLQNITMSMLLYLIKGKERRIFHPSTYVWSYCK